MPKRISRSAIAFYSLAASFGLILFAPATVRADLVPMATSSVVPGSAAAIEASRVHATITRRDDVAEEVYNTAGSAFATTVGRIQFDGQSGSGVLIAPNKVLTAGHVLSGNYTPSTYVFTLNGVSYTGAAKTMSPTWTTFNESIPKGDDIAILTLATDVVGGTLAQLYTGSEEIGNIGMNVGFGFAGTGLTGQQGGLGVLRMGENFLDEFGTFYSNVSANTILQDFDNPAGTSSVFGNDLPLAHEGMAAQGDSGGGLFVDFGSGAVLVGITSFLYDANGNNKLSDYGDVTGTIRVSANLGFINSVIGVPEPSSFVLVAAGIALVSVAGFRKRRSGRSA